MMIAAHAVSLAPILVSSDRAFQRIKTVEGPRLDEVTHSRYTGVVLGKKSG